MSDTVTGSQQDKQQDLLQEHVASTYRSLRRGLVIISFLFPPFLWVIGRFWYGIPFQGSMSAYYFAEADGNGPLQEILINADIGPISYLFFFLGELDGERPMRSWFVGILFVLGLFLLLYKGFSRGENNFLNVAGLAALGVALFPMEWECGDSCRRVTVHDVSAFAAFICIAVVAVKYSKKTLKELPRLADEHKIHWYNMRYNATAVGMIVFPVVALLITLVTNRQSYFVFVAELLGLWTFAYYWFIKSKELDETRVEMLILEKKSQLSLTDAPEQNPAAPKDIPTENSEK